MNAVILLKSSPLVLSINLMNKVPLSIEFHGVLVLGLGSND